MGGKPLSQMSQLADELRNLILARHLIARHDTPPSVRTHMQAYILGVERHNSGRVATDHLLLLRIHRIVSGVNQVGRVYSAWVVNCSSNLLDNSVFHP